MMVCAQRAAYSSADNPSSTIARAWSSIISSPGEFVGHGTQLRLEITAAIS
jgi:hypothetical protein